MSITLHIGEEENIQLFRLLWKSLLVVFFVLALFSGGVRDAHAQAIPFVYVYDSGASYAGDSWSVTWDANTYGGPADNCDLNVWWAAFSQWYTFYGIGTAGTLNEPGYWYDSTAGDKDYWFICTGPGGQSDWNVDYGYFLHSVLVHTPYISSPTSASIGPTSATLGATVTSNGGGALTARGTCYGTSPTPRGNCTAEGGTSVAAFTHVRTGLSCGTTYYYAGYATNSAGTSYTADGSFSTASCGLTVSGTLYTDEGSTALTGSSKTMAMAVGTSTVSLYSTTTNSSTGAWAIAVPAGHYISSSTPITVWVDGDTTTRAAAITKAAGNSSISSFNLYQNRIIIRHEGVSGTSTRLADMTFYDNDNDADIQYNAAPSALVLNTNNELYIWPGDTFSASGTVEVRGNASSTSLTDGSLHIGTGAAYIATGTTTLAGSFLASSTATYTSTSTLLFNATTTGKTILAPVTTLGNVTMNGSGGGWTFGTTSTTSNLTISNGTLTAPSSNLAVTGNYTNNGTFTHNSGTVTFASTSATTTYANFSFDTTSTGNNPYGMTYADGFLWVIDLGNAQVYQYTTDGTYTGVNFDTAASGNADPYNIVYVDGFFWITDYTDTQVYKYTIDGTYTGINFDTGASGNGNPVGITYADGFFWVTDYVDDEVYKYTESGTYTGTSFDTAAVFASGYPVSISYAHGFLWILDYITTEVYKYTTSGTYTGASFDTAASGNTIPWGITYAEGTFWVSNYTNDEVYRYAYGQVASGTMTGTSAFNNVAFSGAGAKAFANTASTTDFTIASASGEVAAPGALSIAGDYTNNGTFSQISGTTTFNGTSAQAATGTMTGTSAFNNLSIINNTATTTFNAPFTATGHFQATTPSAKIELQAGATTTLDTVAIAGGSGTEVWLRSTTPGTKAGLSINDAYSITYIDVKDSSASSTSGIIAATSSLDNGNNNGWSFPTVASLISLANQTFAVNDTATAISNISFTDRSNPTVTIANDIRIKIATSTVHMLWDITDTTATYGGTAAGKVSTTVSYEGDGSVLVIPVTDDFGGGDTLEISGLSFAEFTAVNTAAVALSVYTDGAGDVLADATDSKTVTIIGSLTLADHTQDQVSDSFTYANAADVELYRFTLTPAGEEMTVSSLALTLSGQKGVESDLSNFRLYLDVNSDGIYDGGDTQVGGAGTLSLTGQSGTVTFSTNFTVSAASDYIVVADTADIRPGDSINMRLQTSGITVVGNTIGAAVQPSGSSSYIQHIKNGTGSPGASVGGNAPAGEIRGGGGGHGGGEIDSNTNGTSLGNELGFEDPTTTGTPNNEWTSAGSGYDSDGVYATAVSANLLQSYGTFSFGVPANNQITGIEVKLEGAGTTAAGEIEVALSWNNGESVTTYKTTGTLTGTDAVYTLGSPSDTWGRSWTPAETADGTLQVVFRSQPSSNTIKIDAIRVRVYHQATGGGGGGGGEI